MKALKNINFNHYYITENGIVYNSKMNIIKSVPNKNNGYHQIVLQNKAAGVKPKCFYIHRLVAETYIDNPNNFPEVNHINSIKTDNNFSNLEWCTRKYNLQHMAANKEFERIKFNKINSDKKLVQFGINHYRIYKDINYVNKLWNCSSGLSYEILRLNTVKTNSRYKLSDIIRYKIVDDIKSYSSKRIKKIWIDEIIEKYNKLYNIKITYCQFNKIINEYNKGKFI